MSIHFYKYLNFCLRKKLPTKNVNEYSEELVERTNDFDKNLYNYEWDNLPTVAKEPEKEYTYVDESKLNEIYGEELIERMMNPKPTDAYDFNLQSKIKKANNELKKYQENTTISKKDPLALSKKEFDRAKTDYTNIAGDFVKGFIPGYSLVTSNNRLNEDTDEKYLVTDYNPDDEYKAGIEKFVNGGRTAFVEVPSYFAGKGVAKNINSKTAQDISENVTGNFVGNFLEDAMAQANMNLFDPVQDLFEDLYEGISKWFK